MSRGHKTAPVGSHPGGVSWVGALDMSGNLWEWTSSLYEDYPYDANDGREWDAGYSDRVQRGGSYYPAPDIVRTAKRISFEPESWIFNPTDGFRCARSY